MRASRPEKRPNSVACHIAQFLLVLRTLPRMGGPRPPGWSNTSYPLWGRDWATRAARSQPGRCRPGRPCKRPVDVPTMTTRMYAPATSELKFLNGVSGCIKSASFTAAPSYIYNDGPCALSAHQNASKQPDFKGFLANGLQGGFSSWAHVLACTQRADPQNQRLRASSEARQRGTGAYSREPRRARRVAAGCCRAPRHVTDIHMSL